MNRGDAGLAGLRRFRRLLAALAWSLFMTTVAAGAPAAADVAGLTDPLTPEIRSWVTEQGPIQVGWFRGSEPVSIWAGDQLTGGFGPDLWDLIGRRVGVPVEHVVFDDIPAVVAALASGTIDLAGLHGKRPDLVEIGVASEPLAWERVAFVGAPGQLGLGLTDMGGRRVSTIAGSPLEQALLDGFPTADYVITETLPEGLAATAAREVDLYLAPLAVVGHLTRGGELDLEPVGESVQRIPLSTFALRDTPAADFLVAARAQLTNEEISLVTFRWTGFDLGDPARQAPAWIRPVLLGTLGLAAILGLFALILRRRVARATADLQELNEQLEHRVEERTQQLGESNDQLVASNMALTRFARRVAHDLRGPVTAIASLTKLMRTIDMDRDKQGDVLSTVESSARRLSAMIEEMLDDAIRAGAAPPMLDGADFATWLRAVVAPEVEATKAELVLEIAEGVLPVDPAVLRRAAINLVGNALKYAGSNRGTRVEVALTPGDSAWVLTVDDNGPGIPPGSRGEVFVRGRRLDESDDAGRGMGLADVRDDVQRIGGAVEIDDSPSGGARFTVTLPTIALAQVGEGAAAVTASGASAG